MIKKLTIISVVVLSITIFSIPAWSSVVGTWEVEGNAKVKYKIEGEGSETQKYYAYDEFTFYPEGDFAMIDMEGTWTQSDKKFTVYIQDEDIETYFEDALWNEYGLSIDAAVTKNTFKGEEKKDDTIKGKYKLEMDIYSYDYGVSGKISASFDFKGIREGSISQFNNTDAAPWSDHIIRIIGVETYKRIPSR